MATAASASGRSRAERRAVGALAAGSGSASWRRRFGGAFSSAGALRLGFFLGAAAGFFGAAAGFLGAAAFFERAGAAAGFFERAGAAAGFFDETGAAGGFLPEGFLRAGAAAGGAWRFLRAGSAGAGAWRARRGRPPLVSVAGASLPPLVSVSCSSRGISAMTMQ